MRKMQTLSHGLTVILVGMCALMTSATAQVTNLITFTGHSWQYYEAGDKPADSNGVDWKAPLYDDGGWKTGYGFFAYEADTPGNYAPINTTLTLSNTGAPENIRTYYFRTHFSFSGDPTNVFLHFTNVVDDGCAVYLNGARVYSLRVPQADPTYQDLANGSVPVEGTRELVTVINNALRHGDNVLAAEVKQTAANSADVAWNLALAYSRPDAIAITEQPPGHLDLVQFDDPVLAVEVTGTDPRFRWFRDDVFLNGQTNRTLTLNNISPTQAGTYYVVVSNAANVVRSSNTVIRVVPDTFGPRILDAWVPSGETNRMYLRFNEDIGRVAAAGNTNRSGFNPTNYSITIMGQTNRLLVTQVLVGVGNGQIRLTVDRNFDRNMNYQICVSNITDVRTNAIAWNSCMPVGFEEIINPIVYQDVWAYHEWPFEPDGDWKARDYFEDPTRWIQAQALFFSSISGPSVATCTARNWVMSLGYTTYYFRKQFVIPPDLVGLNMNATLGHAVDDGAVFYLNGSELGRYNMPSGPTTYDTRPFSSVDGSCRTNVFGDVMPGRTNVLAVELHDVMADPFAAFDAAFDASLRLNYIRYPAFPQATNVRVFATNHSATELAVYFSNGYGYTIQTKTNLTDPWREVQPPTNRLITPKSNPSRFFRLEKAH